MSELNLCYECQERPANRASSYCGQCLAIKMRGYRRAGIEKKINLNVGLTKIELFGGELLDMLSILESATEMAERVYLRNQLERTVNNLVSISTGIIKAQIK